MRLALLPSLRQGHIGAALFLSVLSQPVAAQRWQTFESSRQLHDTSSHRVRIQYGAGRIDVSSTAAPVLYSMQLRYDETVGNPVHTYDPDDRSLTLGMGSQTVHFGRNFKDQTKGEMRLALNRAVPMDLDFDLGATRAMLDLGGLSLRDLRIESGASETTVDFSEPNPLRMRALEIQVGAASFEGRNLANANTQTVRVNGGVGNVELGFAGEWRQDMSLDVDVALGKVTLHVPEDVGVRVEVQKFLASFDSGDLRKRGGAYFSNNFDSAKFKLRIRASTTFGGIQIDHDSR